jgi:predicted Fe-Mo cluster-binding NifX family protein
MVFKLNKKRRILQMKLGFPVISDEGMESRIYGHFASAPMFLSVDTESGQMIAFENIDQENPQAGCNPFKALVGSRIDSMIVDGVGDGFIELLNLLGMSVYQAESENIRENVELFAKDALSQLEYQNSADEGRCEDVGEHGCNHNHDEHLH